MSTEDSVKLQHQILFCHYNLKYNVRFGFGETHSVLFCFILDFLLFFVIISLVSLVRLTRVPA